MNWYHRHFFVVAKLSDNAKRMDLRRWLKMHKIVCEKLGLNPSDNIDAFVDMSDIFRTMTDELKRFPHFDEFLVVWLQWHPEWREKLPVV